ncbi:potassium transporter Kup [Roseisolibacter sp. H3M3-2]|uniref:potassium transporter Kup n=1 Tax=Roseisolibacter sp. H3M3-2 TaxID=3031323 RepID=UPI0023DC8683|nr:potassium transporter Kup [Roseisolibacter sp. H3M3-2]MDF1504008.1 potassium transporter Kup [Roseisolibacter sp. H3M3-2]
MSHLPAAPDAPADDRRRLALLTLGALGIVYGDIGTSPLYAVKESFLPAHGVAPTPDNVLGVLSLVIWSLLLVISVKYLVFILRADNRGEGGILALTALVTPAHALRGGRWGLILLGLFGTALLYGDGMITPAISVLSAVEGLEVVTPAFAPFVVPITVAIIATLFLVQSRGTATVGRIFGPVMVVWFLLLAALGVWQVAQAPGVLGALVPTHALRFLVDNGWHGFVVMGSVFLVVTGGEALYADMGHFGARPIRLAWFGLVLPALLLNYFGQGALLVRDPGAVENPFYRMVPPWALVPVLVIATLATVIASQALISGAFSLTLQAVQLGYAPRVQIEHTSATERGQIYIPSVNWALLACCLALVLGFRTSSNLAAAYGVAVTTTMAITTLLFYFVARERWGWGAARAGAVAGGFLLVDLAFWAANLLKIPHGGWVPLVIGGTVFTLLTTWKTGRRILAQRLAERSIPRDVFLEGLLRHPPHRVPGTSVFMYGSATGTPPALLHNLKHNRVLHERVVFLAIRTEEVPQVDPAERASVEALGHGLWQVTLRYGFMEDADVPDALARLGHPELVLRPLDTTYFLGRETLIATRHPGMALWRERLFALLSRNARPATAFFRLPPNRVVELGAQVEL